MIKRLLREVHAVSGLKFADTQRHDPYLSYKFLVEITGNMVFAKAGFQRVTGLKMDVDVVEYREGGDPLTVTKAPGLAKFEPITLERGMSEDIDMWNWAIKVFSTSGDNSNSPSYKANMTIKLQDRNGTIVKQWNVPNSWVSGYETDDLDATASNVLIERLVVQHEGFSKV